MQEELERRSIVLMIEGSKLSAMTLAKGMQLTLKGARGAVRRVAPQNRRRTVKQLAESGSLQSIEISDDNIKAFDPYARKYGVQYALQKDDTRQPPIWLVFFRAQDADALTAAFKEFTAKVLQRERERPSVRQTMRSLSERVRNAVQDRTRRKQREGLER